MIFLVGDDEASSIYVTYKQKQAQSIGITCDIRRLPVSTSQDELLTAIQDSNNDPSVTAILVQLPLPAHIDTRIITQSIHPKKDVDGLHATNFYRLMTGDESGLVPCTPKGIIRLLEHANITIE